MAEPHPPNGAAPQPESVGRKRQRRPSIRLGDISSDQDLLLYDSGNRQSWANSNQTDSDCKKDGIFKTSLRTRALTKRRVAALSAAVRRAWSNWGRDSKFEDTGGNVSNCVEDSGGGDRDDEANEEEEDRYSGRGFILASPIEEEGNVDGNNYSD